MRKPKIIILCGVPGTGKTTLAIKLASLMGIDQIVSTDILRESLRSIYNKEIAPLLFSTTHESWKFFGEKTEDNIIQGITAHSRILYKSIIYLIKQSEKEGRDIILEGVHLIPEITEYIKSENLDVHYFLLHINEKEEHFKRFDTKNAKRFFHEAWYSNFETISFINNWLIKESSKRNLHIMENRTMTSTINEILGKMKNEILSFQ